VPSARNLYRLNLALGALGALTVLAAGIVAARAVDFSATSAGMLVHYCTSLFMPHVTASAVLVLMLAALGVMVVGLGARSAARQLLGQRRFRRCLKTTGQLRFGDTDVVLVDDEQAEAFCAGYLRPRVYLSRGALRILNTAELDAVVAHEKHHAQRRDPLRIFLLGVLADALVFLPALRRLKLRYQELAEVAADHAALRAQQDPAALASALLTFGERQEPGVVGIAPERVDHLLGDSPGWELSFSLVGVAVLTVAGIAGLVLATAPSMGSVSLSLLAVQACMLSMSAVPLLAAAAIVLLVRRCMVRAR
jgi:Zn-dependent protease with chaperone function